MRLRKALLLFALFAFAPLAMNAAREQPEAALPKRLTSPATVEGFIGGESHDSYVIDVQEGQTMTVQISWEPDGDNRASFTVSESPDFFEGELVQFGESSDGGKGWTGKSLRTRDYYIYVVAHPTARYTLRVEVIS